MTSNGTSALVVGRPGPLRDSLSALLTTMPEIETALQTDQACEALSMIVEHHPALVLLDTDLPDEEAWDVLRQIKSQHIQTRCVVLADDGQKQKSARSAGADVALLKGFPAAKLLKTMTKLLSRRLD